MQTRIKHPKDRVEIGIVGKYVDLRESYKSLHEALVHGGLANEVQVALTYIDSEKVEREGAEGLLGHLHGILVPGGFGVRGVEGKIQAIRYAREHRIPYFGICFGMQLAVVEFARHLAGITNATSEEFDPEAADPVIYLMREWYDYRRDAIIRRDRESEKGGTMRLGAYPCVLKEESLAGRAYGQTQIMERHRHRYEFNNDYREKLSAAGLPDHRHLPQRRVGGDRRDQGPSLVPGLPVPPGVQIRPHGPPPPVPGLHPGRPGI